jgi:hypothetical protein
MNLASRCREAISHVAMLKKELSHHQKRAQEALKFQREQTQRMASNLSAEVSKLSLSQSGESESANSSPDRNNQSEMERVLATMDPPPPPPPRPSTGSPPRPKTAMVEDPPASHENNVNSTIRTVSPRGEFQPDVISSSDEDDTVNEESRPNGRSVLDVVESLSDLSSPAKYASPNPKSSELPPRVYSTPNRHRKEDRWRPHIDEAPGSVGKDADGVRLFPHTASPKVVGGYQRDRNYNEEFPPDIVPNHSSSAHQRTNDDLERSSSDDDDEENGGSYYRSSSPPPTSSLQKYNGMITMNSIDAFEASFDTTFPSNFPQKESNSAKPSRESPQAAEIYNPFAPSPARSIDRTTPATPPAKSSRSPNPEIVRTANVSDSGQPWSDDSSQYSTPPKNGQRPELNSNDEPPRPHKTPSAEARARYEKALQPRNAAANSSQASIASTKAVAPIQTDAPEQKSSGGLLMGSPSRLLQRIQQRRKNKDGKDGSPHSSEGVSSHHSHSESSLTQENVAPAESRATQQQAKEPSPRQLSFRSKSTPRSPRSTTPLRRGETEGKPIDGQAQPEINGRPGGMIARLSALKTRRAVKQPISYAEPALNTKIRQGHSYFPKTNDEASAQPRIVTPEQMTNSV